MIYLKELIGLLREKRIQKVEVFNDTVAERKSNYYKLFKAIGDGKVVSDEQAAVEVLKLEPNSKAYKVFKARLKNKLLNSVFFLDMEKPHYSKTLRIHYQCTKYMFSARIFLMFGVRNTAIHFAKKAMRLAERFEITDIVLQCARILRKHYSLTGDLKSFEQIDKQLKSTLKLFNGELEAEELYEQIVIRYAKKEEINKDDLNDVIIACLDIEELRQRFDTFQINIYYFRMNILYKSIAQDYLGLLTYCDEMEQYFQNWKEPVSDGLFGEVYLTKMVGYMHLRDFEAGEKLSKQCLKLLTDGTYTWFRFLEYYFILSMQTGNYSKAEEIFKLVTKNIKFSNMPEQIIEKWKIFEPFLIYCLNYARNPEAPAKNLKRPKQKFNPYKFVNEVPIYSKDKRGLNIAIIIAQILFLLEARKYEEIKLKMESLKIYSSRYLRKEINLRNNIFIKMLITMIKCDFEYEKTKRRAEAYLNNLKDAKLNYQGNLDGFEIVPYEILWTMVLTRLWQFEFDSSRVNKNIKPEIDNRGKEGVQ